jgi:ABC-type thiamin/hydroxymethylpyrimidine transport system permease subunit
MKVKIIKTGEIKQVAKVEFKSKVYIVQTYLDRKHYLLGEECYLINQTKGKSLIEATVNTLIGLLTSFVLQLILYPFLDIKVSLNQNIIITLVFFIVSIIRGYLIRRFFNKR